MRIKFMNCIYPWVAMEMLHDAVREDNIDSVLLI